MLGLTLFLSVCVATSVIWLLAMIGYIMQTGGFRAAMERPLPDMLMLFAGLFLPILTMAIACAMIYVALELKKTQMIFKDWLRNFKRELTLHEASIHALIGKQLQEELNDDRDTQTYQLPFEETTRTVMNILKDEPISKYKDLELPDDVDLHFVDRK